ncbi:MAG: nucleotide pyrophosphohydrolase [Defluviitaleaceae bacterium]|nr:nucleotide pyrophosphohydrolase [Defluviitaleaceae bacterium]MCL2239933.1 nucleotide pyrophosphohydrolase [Defluviitaleaceae bacterium]
MNELNTILETLLGDTGCPWDRAQTHESLRPYLLEEAQEAVQAIDAGDMDALREELGDVLLQVVFHAKLAQRSGHFTLEDVVAGLCEKLIRRHTHVFGGEKAATAQDALRIWAENKRREKEI